MLNVLFCFKFTLLNYFQNASQLWIDLTSCGPYYDQTELLSFKIEYINLPGEVGSDSELPSIERVKNFCNVVHSHLQSNRNYKIGKSIYSIHIHLFISYLEFFLHLHPIKVARGGIAFVWY